MESKSIINYSQVICEKITKFELNQESEDEMTPQEMTTEAIARALCEALVEAEGE